MKGRVGRMPGQVCVVASMMVPGSPMEITQRPDDRQMMSLLGEMRQVFAEFDAWCLRVEWVQRCLDLP